MNKTLYKYEIILLTYHNNFTVMKETLQPQQYKLYTLYHNILQKDYKSFYLFFINIYYLFACYVFAFPCCVCIFFKKKK